jgi:hypothetical protein
MNIDLALLALTLTLSTLTFIIVGIRYRRGDYNRDAKR